MGKVYLIGAGPGDEMLLTLKAAQVLEKCSAVLYDRLAGEKYLKYLNDSCEIYYCGKEPGCHYKTQEEINKILIELAKKGHTIGRLKGGDPYVFGRGGEEALSLQKEGIPFEVIPGITSPIAVLNYAGIPITHRGIAQSFHVFTGKSVDKLNINWDSVSKLEGTLVFLMGLANLENIITQLVQHGKSVNTPCAVIMKGTTARQQKALGTLADIVQIVARKNFTSPCIIVVGQVVNFSNQLNWYEQKALFGKNICITRTKEQAAPLRKKLLDLGAEVTQIHSIEIKPNTKELDLYTEKLSEYDFVVFTSVNGVELFFDYLIKNNIDIRKIKGEFAAIGPATREAIKKFGIVPSILADEFLAESLFEALKDNITTGDKILLPTSEQARDYLEENLKKCGASVDRVNIYKPEVGRAVENFEASQIVIFTSPSTVKNMIQMVGLDSIKEKISIAIGPITEQELLVNDIRPYTCETYTVDGIINQLLSLLNENKL